MIIVYYVVILLLLLCLIMGYLQSKHRRGSAANRWFPAPDTGLREGGNGSHHSIRQYCFCSIPARESTDLDKQPNPVSARSQPNPQHKVPCFCPFPPAKCLKEKSTNPWPNVVQDPNSSRLRCQKTSGLSFTWSCQKVLPVTVLSRPFSHSSPGLLHMPNAPVMRLPNAQCR